jgi:hypothetical protein
MYSDKITKYLNGIYDTKICMCKIHTHVSTEGGSVLEEYPINICALFCRNFHVNSLFSGGFVVFLVRVYFLISVNI